MGRLLKDVLLPIVRPQLEGGCDPCQGRNLVVSKQMTTPSLTLPPISILGVFKVPDPPRYRQLQAAIHNSVSYPQKQEPWPSPVP